MNKKANDIIKNTLQNLSHCFWHCLIFSCIINILSLALPIYSMQVLDRVLGSSSVETLIYLSLIIFAAVCAMNFLTNVRDSAFSYIADSFEKKLGDITFKQNIKACSTGNAGNIYLRDLATIKNFIASPNLALIFDFPWTLIFLAVIFHIHWILGFVVLAFTIILTFMAFLNQKILRPDSEKLNELQAANSRKLELLTNNSESIIGNGMTQNVNAKYNQDLIELKNQENLVKKKSKTISTIVKTVRYAMQISITFISAILIIDGKMSSGGYIAVSILSSKVLAPFDATPSIVQALVGVKKSYLRLHKIFDHLPVPRTRLPEPKGNVAIEQLIYSADHNLIIKNISFKVNEGEIIGIIGKSGSGKTTLARLLTGIFEPTKGKILLNSSPLKLWPEEQIGKYIGYLPQDVELFQAKIKENIARFDIDAKDEDVVNAAMNAGVHELIMSFAQGYETEIGLLNISAGQRQRIALARAFYGNPKILVLDEPNSNLDVEGENALLKALLKAKEDKITVFIISHKPSILSIADKIAVINDGELKTFEDAKKVIENFSSNTKPC